MMIIYTNDYDFIKLLMKKNLLVLLYVINLDSKDFSFRIIGIIDDKSQNN